MATASFLVPARTPGRGRSVAALLVLAGLLAWLFSGVAWAASGEPQVMRWGSMSMKLFGGLALFLFGMEQMADALKSVAGERMKDILGRLTTNRIMGLLTGTFVTAIIQSSSVTTVMLVGFVTAGLMSLSQAIGVILGADIGTTITAQIVAFKVTEYALLLVAVGFLFVFTAKNNRVQQYGYLCMGLGLIFFGMGVMSEAMKPLRSYEPFIDLMRGVENPLVGILVATAFTGIVQSSSATMGVVIALALQGLISLEAGIALALGANIGTCVTAGLAAIGKPREAVRVAVAHVTFKILGVLIIVGFIPLLADLVRSISPVAEAGLSGADKLAAETPRQIANAHTIFNVGLAFTFLPFSAQFARFCEWVVPDRPLAEQPAVVASRYLDDALLDTPSLALDRTRLEALHMGEYVEVMLRDVMPAIFAGDRAKLESVREGDEAVDRLHEETVAYLAKISRGELTDQQTRDFMKLMEAVNNLENMGDIIETDLVDLGNKLVDENVKMSDGTRQVLGDIHAAVSRSVQAAVLAVSQNSVESARIVTSMKDDMNRLIEAAEVHQATRLVAAEPGRIPAYTIEVEIIEKLKRIYYFAKRMAKTVPHEDAPAETMAEAAPAA